MWGCWKVDKDNLLLDPFSANVCKLLNTVFMWNAAIVLGYSFFQQLFVPAFVQLEWRDGRY